MTLQDVETARLNYYRVFKHCCTIGIIIGLLFVAFSIYALLSDIKATLGIPIFVIFLAIAIISFAIIIVITSKPRAEYHKAYKAYFVEQNLRAVFSDLKYSHEQGLKKDLLASTGMIKMGDRYSSNDFVSGKYKDVAFAQSDVHIEEEHTDSDGDTYYVTIFKGRIMLFDFPKKFDFKLELIGKKFRAYRIPGKNPTTGREMQSFNTESTEFNDSFKIYGEDGFEAFYILDPAFIVKIQDISDRHQGKVLLGFVDNHLIIALNDNTDSFEPPKVYKPINEAEEHKKISTDIQTITNFISQLSLDRKLFKP